MKKRVLLPFTTGVEEIEFTAIVDILRRADIEVCAASLDGQPVTGRSNITIHADAALKDVMHHTWDMIVLPGGLPNAHLLRDDANVKHVVERLKNKGKVIASICAAPTILAAYGITQGKKVTAYPSCQDDMERLQPQSIYVDEAVVEDGLLITSQGPGTAIAFALRLVQHLLNDKIAQQIKKEVVAL